MGGGDCLILYSKFCTIESFGEAILSVSGDSVEAVHIRAQLCSPIHPPEREAGGYGATAAGLAEDPQRALSDDKDTGVKMSLKTLGTIVSQNVTSRQCMEADVSVS